MNNKYIDVLMLTASYGGGHVQASKAIVLGLQVLKPELQIETIDYVRWINSTLEYITRLFYLKVTSKVPGIWHLLYDVTDRPFFAKYGLIRRLGFNRLYSYISFNKPKIIISTHFLTSAVVGEMKRRGYINVPLVTIITDNVLHAFWLNPHVDLYLVANEKIKEDLIKHGISKSSIKVTGIPIDLNFTHQKGKNMLRIKNGLAPELPTILVMSGAYGMGDIFGICEYLASCELDLQVIIVTGKDKKLRNRIMDLAMDSKNKFTILGYVTNVFDWMGLADLLVSKAGGLTTSEALASNLPMLIYRPIPGQEVGNADYLVKAGVARIANNMDQFTNEFESILGNPEVLAKMTEKCSIVKKPFAALKGSELLLQIVNF